MLKSHILLLYELCCVTRRRAQRSEQASRKGTGGIPPSFTHRRATEPPFCEEHWVFEKAEPALSRLLRFVLLQNFIVAELLYLGNISNPNKAAG